MERESGEEGIPPPFILDLRLALYAAFTGAEQSPVFSAHGWESVEAALMAAEKNDGNSYEFATAK